MEREWEGIFRQMGQWAKEMEEFINHILSARPQSLTFGPEVWRPPVNVFETQEAVIVLTELAGIGPDDVSVRYEAGRLIVVGRRPDPIPAGCLAVHRLEIPTGPFAFEVSLPLGVTPEEAKATCRNGWLEIRLPKAATAPPETITIRLA